MEFKYRAEMEWNDSGTISTVPFEHIKSIVIDRDYDGKNMPTIYVTVSMARNLLDKVILSKNNSTFIFRLYKFALNEQSFEEEYINDEFVYFLSQDINYDKNVDFENEDEQKKDDNYTLVTLGLMKQKLININKGYYGGSFKDVSTTAILLHITKGIDKLIFENPIPYKYKSLLIPPIESLSKTIEFINSLHTIYKTPYRFFMDLDISYILSSSGLGIETKDEPNNTIDIQIKDPASYGAVEQGIILDKENKIYRLLVNANSTRMYNDNISDKSFNVLYGVSATTTQVMQLNVAKSKGSSEKRKILRIHNENFELLDNHKESIEMSGNTLTISKPNIDCSVITPNKKYIVKNVQQYMSYDGIYILSRKREIYMYKDGNLSLENILNFKTLKK